MSKINYTKFAKIYNNIEKYPTLSVVGKALGIGSAHVSRMASKYRSEGKKLRDRSVRVGVKRDPEAAIEETKLKNEINFLKKELTEARKKAVNDNELVKIIHEINKISFKPKATWLKNQKMAKSFQGIPTLFLSDLHYDEVVNPAEIGYVNKFNREIANARLKYTFHSAIKLLFNYMSKPKYQGIVLALGGDMVSGNIHEELRNTNEGPILESVVELTQVLIEGITFLLEHFDRVFVPCVVGNHGRLDKKPKAKNRIKDNYEWLIYQYISKHFADDKRVHVEVPLSPDCIFQVYDKTFLLTHGDQFKGGNGIAGIMSPLHLGLHRKQKKQSAIHNPFDVMMLGHFHQYIHTNAMVVNGSLKGYDEYANLCNFPWEPAQQALWINHPRNGMIFRTPVLCDETKGVKTQKDFFAQFRRDK